MWFWLFVIILTIGIGAMVVGSRCWDHKKHPFLSEYDEEIMIGGSITTVLSAFVVIIMLSCIINSHTNIDAKLEQRREEYTALTYKMESTACRDEFGFLSKEIIDEVQKWNKDVRYHQNAQDDFWVGIFYPNVYDEFETIDYESYNAG